MKKLVIVSNLNIVDKLVNYADAFLFGITDLSVNMPITFSLEELETTISYLNVNKKEVFISLNKNMHNKDLELLEKTLIKLNDFNIMGVLYYDIAVVNLKNKLGLKYDLIWAQEHMTNNYFTSNYWLSKGVNYTLLSSEITLNEILNIKNNTDSKLIVPIFGYQVMFTSSRHLVNSYLKTFNISDSSDINYIKRKDSNYPIVDNDKGTEVYNSTILEGLKESLELEKNNIDYILLNSFMIDDDKFIEVVKMFNEVNCDNVLELTNKLYSMFDNLGKNFLYNETIYRVKKNEENK